MKESNHQTTSTSVDHRPLVLLALGLSVVIIHLCQFPPFTSDKLQTMQTEVQFSWLKDQPHGEGLYRIPTTAKIQGQALPNRLRPLFFQPVSINRADQQLLSILPGIGPILADRIVQWRQTKGDFKSAQDLLQVNGIGIGKLNKIRNQLVFD